MIMKKLILFLLLIVISQFTFAQEALNNYKYIIVPRQYDFQKGEDSFKINSLTKFLLDKSGFSTLFNNEVFPAELMNNQCLALKINLIEHSNFKRTKIKLSFINCQNQVVYESEEGVSTSKDYQKSYHEAIRGAFNSLDNFNYNFTPKVTANVDLPKIEVKNDMIVKDEVVVKPVIEEKVIPNIAVAVKKEVVTVLPANVNKSVTLVGLYQSNQKVFEIAAFQNYFIFSEQIKQGNAIQTKPLGFIYNTSKKGTYSVKTTDTFTGYLLENGDFVIDEINSDGTVKTTTYQKIKS